MKFFLIPLFLITHSFCPFGALAASEGQEADALDGFVWSLDMERLQSIAGDFNPPGGFAVHFFATLKVFLTENPQWTPADVERRLQKWKTGMRLLAVAEKFIPKDPRQKLCLSPYLQESASPTHYMWLIPAFPRNKFLDKREYGFIDDPTNLTLLETVGALSEDCP